MAHERTTPTNGARPIGVGALAAAGLPSSIDPMARVLGLDAQSSSAVAWVGYTLGAIALMIGLSNGVRLIGLALALTNGAPAAASSPQEIEVEEAPPPPPPPAEQEPEKPEPAAPPRPVAHEAPPPPAPAQAGKVLTQEPDPNEPVDLTGNTFVTGNADSYAGGTTMANGTSKTAVRGFATPDGKPGAPSVAQPAPVAAGPDRTRHAHSVNRDWNVPFPPEADGIDDAVVTLSIDLRADGTPAAVRVLEDPGNGFGRAARAFAMTQRYEPELNRDGNPIATTFKIHVHFFR